MFKMSISQAEKQCNNKVFDILFKVIDKYSGCVKYTVCFTVFTDYTQRNIF